jgi:sulfate adenylyltransferase subunit 2
MSAPAPRDPLDALESRAIFILREAYAGFKHLAMLWSIGKDSTVMLHLARKAFLGSVPFPLIHIDTSYKIPEMTAYRDRLALEWKLKMIVGRNDAALKEKKTFPDGAVDRLTCCGLLKTQALKDVVSGDGERRLLNLKTGRYELDADRTPFTGIIAGIRADEEGTRSKERYFSPRNQSQRWDLGEQPPEFWNQYKTDFAPGTHVRIHPLLDWREVDVWDYIRREGIPTVSLYYDQGTGKRYRSLGCYPCTFPVESNAKNPMEIVAELRTGKFKDVAERSGRAQDADDGGTLENLRREGYM